MYRPKAFRESDTDKLVDFMRAYPFCTLIVAPERRPIATHIPVVVTTDGDDIMLRGHVARANPVWKVFEDDEALVIFGGPHVYVSPSSYDNRESVPTWNYIAVHAYGVPRAVHFKEAAQSVQDMLSELIDTYESAYGEQWNSLPQEFREGLMLGIVGFEMPVTRLEGQFKLSQNRSAADQENVASTLMQASDPAAVTVGKAMHRNLEDAQANR